MAIFVKLKETIRQIEKKINQAVASQLNRKLRAKKGAAEKQIRTLVKGWILEQPEVGSLLDQGVPRSLNAEFGLPPGTPELAVAAIIDTLVSAVTIELKPFDSKLRGGVTFNVPVDAIPQLLGIPEGFQITEKGDTLHWLQWLLEGGDGLIIVGYTYVPLGGAGRSGGGYMAGGGIYRVRSDYRGFVDNNFITRAFEKRDTSLGNVLGLLLG